MEVSVINISVCFYNIYTMFLFSFRLKTSENVDNVNQKSMPYVPLSYCNQGFDYHRSD